MPRISSQYAAAPPILHVVMVDGRFTAASPPDGGKVLGPAQRRQKYQGRRIAAKHRRAAIVPAAAKANAAGSEKRSATKASTSGPLACMTSVGRAIRPKSRP